LTGDEAEALAQSAALTERIAAEIGSDSIGFSRFMDLALYSPGLGYYSGGATKFGAAGDFVTAPELGPAFARILAHALAPTLATLETPAILEIGAGSGALAADLVPALTALGVPALRYLILERSAELRDRQRTRLAGLPVEFLTAPPSTPFDGAIIANEVIDALAVDCFEIVAGRVVERAVGFDGGLQWRRRPANADLAAAVGAIEAELGAFAEGYCSEVLLSLPAFVRTLTAPLRCGVAVFVDYGYGRCEFYRPERRHGTLICHYRQRAHDDPFFRPGLNDISAFVDFTALAMAGAGAGLDLIGYDSQAGFLLHQDLPAIFAELGALPDRERLRLTNALKRLMLPGEMGERFKVMTLAKGQPNRLERLSMHGQRHLL
jgi:SAM-dependent MidA family methyltransferase